MHKGGFELEYADSVMGDLRFGEVWRAMLWSAMAHTGRGYKRESVKFTGRSRDRRSDKCEGGEFHRMVKWHRSYRKRYSI